MRMQRDTSMENQRRYYPTIVVLYISFFADGIANAILGQFKQELAALWNTPILSDGSRDVSDVIAVISSMGLGRLISITFGGKLSDCYGRKQAGALSCLLFVVFFVGFPLSGSVPAGYFFAVVGGVAIGLLDEAVTPTCMEVFGKNGTTGNLFSKLFLSLGQMLLPLGIAYATAHALPFSAVFYACAGLFAFCGAVILLVPFPPFVHTPLHRRKEKAASAGEIRLSGDTLLLILLGFTTSATFMIWLNCNQELGALYGLANVGRLQSIYSAGSIAALLVNVVLLRRGVKPLQILLVYPSMAVVTLLAMYVTQSAAVCLFGSFCMGFFAAGGLLQLVSSLGNMMFPRNKGMITSLVMFGSALANFVVLYFASVLVHLGGTEGPRNVLLFNAAITLVGVAAAAALNARMNRAVPDKES